MPSWTVAPVIVRGRAILDRAKATTSPRGRREKAASGCAVGYLGRLPDHDEIWSRSKKIDTRAIRDRVVPLAPNLDQQGRRSFAAAAVRSAGYGGIAAVAGATGVGPSMIGRGLEDLSARLRA